jgi:transcription elongation GreA/GreB family factor
MQKVVSKAQVKKLCEVHLEQKLTQLNSTIQELADGVVGKSSAGDKHETERAMAQLQQEQLTVQINQLLDMLQVVKKLPENEHNVIQQGSLVETNRGWFYIATAIGKLNVDNLLVMIISAQAPLAVQLNGKKINDCIQVNGQAFQVLGVH